MLNSNMVVDWDSEMAEVERITFDFKITEEVVGEVAYMMNYTGESLNYLYWHDADGGYVDCSKQEDFYEKDVEALEKLGSVQEFSCAIMLDRFCMEISEYQEEMVEGYARETDHLMT